MESEMLKWMDGSKRDYISADPELIEEDQKHYVWWIDPFRAQIKI